MGKRALSIAGLGLAFFLAGRASALPPGGIALMVGPFEVHKPEQEISAGWEFRFRERRYASLPKWMPPLAPIGGVLSTSEGAFYGYGGFRAELPLARRWLVSPHISAGLYTKGEGLNLGGEIQFRSGVDLLFQVHGASWVGVSFSHISNARLYDSNPGGESLLLTYRTGLGRHRE